ncbi:MAG TPA: ankyrin repeat domain-containing protein [Acidimicrobiales bacterium]|jgi:ankyrin repeat protein|nr:ankyrin repeat domain-containing protein [Acidimicrobiales bacterium]
MTTIADDEPIAVAVTQAVHAGDLVTLTRLLGENPSLATARIAQSDCDDDQGTDSGRTLLHVATDWPGNFPNGAATVRTLVGAGADVNARCRGPESAETPLHWAASSNDIDVLDALVEAGADIEAPGAVIGGGPPLADATAFGQWKAARRLVEHGARTTLWHAAALGLTAQIEGHLAGEPAPTADEITQAFWAACHGAQPGAAELLLGRGADLNWVATWDGLTPLDAARRSEQDGLDPTELVAWLLAHGAKSASEVG